MKNGPVFATLKFYSPTITEFYVEPDILKLNINKFYNEEPANKIDFHDKKIKFEGKIAILEEKYLKELGMKEKYGDVNGTFYLSSSGEIISVYIFIKHTNGISKMFYSSNKDFTQSVYEKFQK